MNKYFHICGSSAFLRLLFLFSRLSALPAPCPYRAEQATGFAGGYDCGGGAGNFWGGLSCPSLKFSPAFFKRRPPASGQVVGRSPMSRSAERETPLGIFFFVDCPRRVLPRQSVFFCASGLKRKKRLTALKLHGITGVLCLRLVFTLG